MITEMKAGHLKDIDKPSEPFEVIGKITDEREITSARLHLVAQNLRTLYFLIRYSGGGCQFDIIFL